MIDLIDRILLAAPPDTHAQIDAAAQALPAPAALGFGRHLGPLVVRLLHTTAHGWGEPELVPLAACTAPVLAGALQYGQSVFEGCKAQRGPDGGIHLFRPEAHARRFAQSAERLCLPAIADAQLVALCAAAASIHAPLVPPHGQGALYLRPTLLATEPFLGVRSSARHELFVAVSPMARPRAQPLQVFIESDAVRAAAGGLGATKTGANYAVGLQALESARARGFDQILFLDARDRRYLSEAGTNNVFVVLRDRVLTPPLDGTLLAGVTRDACITLLRDGGLTVEERAPSVNELAALASTGALREVFCTGTASAVVGIGRVTGAGLDLTLPDGAVTAALRASLEACMDGSGPDPHGWRVPCAPRPPAPPARPRAPRTPDAARAFAAAWADAWNRRALDEVLAHFDEEAVFESPRAVALVGAARLCGKAAIARYWGLALARISALHFRVEDVTLDAAQGRVVIEYTAQLNDTVVHAAEHLTFGAAGRVVRGRAFYGANVVPVETAVAAEPAVAGAPEAAAETLAAQ